jgi:hypothetical protein
MEDQRFIGNPLSLQPGCLQQADDIIVTQYGMLESRWGYGLGVGFTKCTDLYSPEHLRYGFLVADGKLYQCNEDTTSESATLITENLIDEEYFWASTPTGDNTFFAGTSEAGWVNRGKLWPLRMPMPPTPEVIATTGTMPAGKYQITQIYRHIETGLFSPAAPSFNIQCSDNCGLLLTSFPPIGYAADIYVSAADSTVERFLVSVSIPGVTMLYDTDPSNLQWPTLKPFINSWTFPEGQVDGLAWMNGYLFVGVHSYQSNITRIYKSKEWMYHLFERDAWEEDDAGFRLTGRCMQMVGMEEGLLVATDTMIGLVSPDMKKLTKLANYGARPGRPIAKDNYGAAIHTVRGIRTFPPWDEGARLKYIPAPGETARAFVGEMHGMRFAQVQTDDSGSAFNTY